MGREGRGDVVLGTNGNQGPARRPKRILGPTAFLGRNARPSRAVQRGVLGCQIHRNRANDAARTMLTESVSARHASVIVRQPYDGDASRSRSSPSSLPVSRMLLAASRSHLRWPQVEPSRGRAKGNSRCCGSLCLHEQARLGSDRCVACDACSGLCGSLGGLRLPLPRTLLFPDAMGCWCWPRVTVMVSCCSTLELGRSGGSAPTFGFVAIRVSRGGPLTGGRLCSRMRSSHGSGSCRWMGAACGVWLAWP